MEEIESTGNWLDYNWYDAAANDLSNYDRTHNAVNEITGWTKSSTSVGTIAYDAAGQMTQNDRYRYVYDGFGRMVALKDASGNPIATYGYNGLGFRIWEQPTGGDKRYLCYDERWRIVATFDDTNATPTRRVIHHAAGAAGMGRSSYIDSVILEDANESGDAALETRYYPLQNWRADVVCVGKLNDEDFQLVEVVDYDTYGNALSRPAANADFDHNGGVDGADQSAWLAAYELGDPSADVDLNSGIDGGDLAAWFPLYESGISGPSRGACAYSGVIAGYAGYVRDRFALYGELYHVRHRVYDTRMGTWTRRDPLGYVDGMGLYGYVQLQSITHSDHFGQKSHMSFPVMSDPATDAVLCALRIFFTSEHPCDYLLRHAMNEPVVAAAVAAKQSACPGLPKIYFHECSSEAEFTWNTFGDSEIRFCPRPNGACPSYNDVVNVLVHELTHATQACAYSGSATWNTRWCTTRLTHEIAGYCAEPRLSPYCTAAKAGNCAAASWVCANACLSVTGCYSAMNCQSKCLARFACPPVAAIPAIPPTTVLAPPRFPEPNK